MIVVLLPDVPLKRKMQVRSALIKFTPIIADCCYGIHDISRIELDENSGFPRFNMPLELGIFLGAKQFGIAAQKEKKCFVLDKEPYRYQQFISDIAGQDIQAHNNEVETIVKVVRNWLRTAAGRQMIPGGDIIWKHYQEFLKDLPRTAGKKKDFS